MSHSPDIPAWQSFEWRESQAVPGVRFRLARISLARRLEIAKRIRALAGELEFAEAGATPEDQLRTLILRCSIDRIYIEQGLLELTGLSIDGAPVTIESLVERGPETLCLEIAKAAREQCTLSEEERKN